MEELILQAEGEIKLMSKMEKEQVWEPLVQVAPVGQWNQ